MMKEISMNIMDIVQNSLKAEATQIEIYVVENLNNNIFEFSIKDNGRGMSAETLSKIRNPFFTSRDTRKIGLGIPFIEQTCQMCGGKLEIKSRERVGTYVKASMEYNNIDRPPLGDICSTIQAIIVSNPNIDFIYTHFYNNKNFSLDTILMREVLGDISFSDPLVMEWIKEYLQENMYYIKI